MLQHTQAVEAAIKSIPALATKTYISTARVNGVLPSAPYVVIHPDDGLDTQERLTAAHDVQNPRFVLHIVGSSYNNAATVAAVVKGKFIDVNGFGIRLTVAGENPRSCWWSGLPVQVDDDLTPPLVYVVAELGFTTEPNS
jgi:hypothetical protein